MHIVSLTDKLQKLRPIIAEKQYGKCPKILNAKVSDKMIYANCADPDETAPDMGLHCLPFH